MITNVPTALAGISLGDANRKMIKHGTDVIPVLDKEKRLQSVVFKKDVVTKEDDVITFDEASIVLTDANDTVIDIESVSFDSTAEANKTFKAFISKFLSACI